ncbi:merozoite TRAP-like protein, putative [Plasmodium yoelii]|uniref:Merozoite TRAP-like protein n=2 Tax=Plasmodium yoelii TaxID=5861 RepID=A0AAE9WSJ2_PLAYO|nr:merozoite TRAP-like protein, putative [Plasmodium yoelii]WBY55658.1 merozoite TRAP-like protein [Plasmodium yoelii yoelii]CDU16727.1 merozoite TRAP-like protein, putative [Plasmodium yoelii]VTZ74280.1 merozoite TRAP-like protein, putative [Plasmodium yoelii]|eukprot:XP_022811678.1 merozoite TRAP-like protein, putative [Plasmodium yoelii]
MKTQITNYLYVYIIFLILKIKYNSANETCDNWGPWGPCTNQITTRTCLTNTSLIEKEDCSQCKGWSEWLECKNGKRSRHMINCPFIIDIQDCLTDINGEISYKNKQVIYDNSDSDSENQQTPSNNNKSTIKPHFLQSQEGPQQALVQGADQKGKNNQGSGKDQAPGKAADGGSVSAPASGAASGPDAAANKAGKGAGDSQGEKKVVAGSEPSNAISQGGSPPAPADGQKVEGKSGETGPKSAADKVVSGDGVSEKDPKVQAASGSDGNVLNDAGSGVAAAKKGGPEGGPQVNPPVKQAPEVPGNGGVGDPLVGNVRDINHRQGHDPVPPVDPSRSPLLLPTVDLSSDFNLDPSVHPPPLPSRIPITNEPLDPYSKEPPTLIPNSIESLMSRPGPAPAQAPGSVPAPGPGAPLPPNPEGRSPELSVNQNDGAIGSDIDSIGSELNRSEISSPNSVIDNTGLNNMYERNNDLNSMGIYNYHNSDMSNNLHRNMNPHHGDSLDRPHNFSGIRSASPSSYYGPDGSYRDADHINNPNSLYGNSQRSNLRSNINDTTPFEYNNDTTRHDNYNSHGINGQPRSHESYESYEANGEEEHDHNRDNRSKYNNSEDYGNFNKLFVATGMGLVIILSGTIASYALYNEKNKPPGDSIFNSGFADIPASKMIHEDEFWGTE